VRATLATLLLFAACDYDWDSFRTVVPEEGLVVHLPLDDVSDGATLIEHLEAETLPAGGCADVPGYFNFCSDANVLEKTVDLPAAHGDHYLFAARVYGVPAEGVPPEMALLVDGSNERTTDVEALADAPVIVQDDAVLEPGPHVFEIQFLNDAFEPENRDLRVDWLEVSAIGESGRALELVSRQRDAVAFGPVETTGMRAGALAFDGVDDDVVLETPIALGEAYTVAFWMRPRDLGGVRALVALHADIDVLVRSSGTDLQALGYAAASAAWPEYDAVVEGALAVGEWRHIAFVVEGLTAVVYVDGVERATETYADTTHEETPQNLVYVGQSGWHWMRDWFFGDLDDVRVYDRALAAGEIAALLE
jgi:hypothetical protein